MVTVKEMFGERIKARRELMGFKTQGALASKMDIDRARVSDWERGKREPKGELRATLLRLLKCSESDIFGVINQKQIDSSAEASVALAAKVLAAQEFGPPIRWAAEVLQRLADADPEHRASVISLLYNEPSLAGVHPSRKVAPKAR